MKRYALAIVVGIVACSCGNRGLAVSYTATFDATWSQASHPDAYPAGAHFSALIGGVHRDAVSFWAPGQLASAGIEQMAEVGGTSALRSEVQAAIDAGTAAAVIQGSGVTSPGTTSVTFDVSPEFPLVTLVSMVAPTPDWFVGVHGLDLRDGAGWKDELIVDLFGYDAGTEEGTGFSLSNPATVPPQPIALLGYPFDASDPRLGTFTFTRNSPGGPMGDFNDDGAVDAGDYVVWRRNFGSPYTTEDYDNWRANFGATIGNGSAGISVFGSAVPEPATWVLVWCAAIVAVGRRAMLRR